MIKDVRHDLHKLDVGEKKLRTFAFLLFGISALYSGIGFWLHGILPAQAIPLYAGILLLLLGTFLPGVLRAPYRIWMLVAFIFGWLISRILIIFIFCFLITPIGWIMRLIGKQPFLMHPNKNEVSYWKLKKARVNHYEKLF